MEFTFRKLAGKTSGLLVHRIALWMGIYVLFTITLYIISDFFFSTESVKQSEPQEPQLLIQLDEENDWIQGSMDAALTIVFYGDYQDGRCAELQQSINYSQRELGEKLRYVYRHFPLKDENEHASLAAQAAEAAGNQDSFWQMHEMLYERQEEWKELEEPQDTFVGYASVLNVDTEQFLADIEGEETTESVDEDYFGGLASGIDSVPTLFLNGEHVNNVPETNEGLLNLLLNAIEPKDTNN